MVRSSIEHEQNPNLKTMGTIITRKKTRIMSTNTQRKNKEKYEKCKKLTFQRKKKQKTTYMPRNAHTKMKRRL